MKNLKKSSIFAGISLAFMAIAGASGASAAVQHQTVDASTAHVTHTNIAFSDSWPL